MPDAEDRTGPVSILVDAPTGRGCSHASLVCIAGDELGHTVVLDGPVLDIGRSKSGMALGGSEVSRRHACVRREPGGFVLEDLGSANGTYLNGERVAGTAPLRPGDRISIGRSVLLFTCQDELGERAERLSRLEALGTLAGGIAHDFNNALSVIIANLMFVEEAVPADHANGQESLAAIRGAAQSATSLAKRLLRLGSRDPLTIGTVALGPLVEQTLRVATRRAEVRPALEVELAPDLIVLGSFDELQHTLLNLYFNACDAMPRGGTFRVRARGLRLDRADALARGLETAGEYVELSVSDTGTGMDAATRARLFEPFFTTKGKGKGTGLGLAQVHGTLRRHGGAIEVDSAPGAGTTFRILLHRAR